MKKKTDSLFQTPPKKEILLLLSLSLSSGARAHRQKKTPTNTRFWARDGDYHPHNENIFGLI
jgi:hypothetical protein